MWHMYMLTCFLSTLMVRLVCSFDLFRIISSHSPNIVTFGLNFAWESGIPRKRRIPVSIPISNGWKARNPLSFFDKITPFSTYKLVKIRGLRVHYSFLDSPPPARLHVLLLAHIADDFEFAFCRCGLHIKW